MDEYDVYIVEDDDEWRNATRDHRTKSPSGSPPPPSSGIVRARPARVIVPSQSGLARYPGRPASAVVVNGQPASRPVLGGLSTGELIEVAAQILAAIQPLPAAPVATGKTETDIANLVTYQGALAVHAKRDEQLRTIGSLVGKLLD